MVIGKVSGSHYTRARILNIHLSGLPPAAAEKTGFTPAAVMMVIADMDHNVEKAVNPSIAECQLVGAIVKGIGFVL